MFKYGTEKKRNISSRSKSAILLFSFPVPKDPDPAPAPSQETVFKEKPAWCVGLMGPCAGVDNNLILCRLQR